MATAKRIQPEPPPATVVLELTEGEAGYLERLLSWHIVGRGKYHNLNFSIARALSNLLAPGGTSAPLPNRNGVRIYLEDD